MGLKEKFASINKKKVSIVLLILLMVVVAGLGSFQYVKNNNIKKQKAAAIQKMMEEAASQQKEENAQQPKRPSEYAVGEDFNKALKSNKPVLTLFYADWCGYCIRFMPIYEALSKKYAKDVTFAKINVEDPNYEQVVKDYAIGGFPTVYIVDPKYDNRVLLSNSVLGSVENVSVELDRFIKIRKILDKKS